MLRLVVIVLISISIISCAGIKTASRKPVDDINTSMVSSSFAPEPSEDCKEVGRITCPYMQLTIQAPHNACVKHSLAEAKRVNADYIHVDEPKARMGGFKLGATKAIMYKCTNLSSK